MQNCFQNYLKNLNLKLKQKFYLVAHSASTYALIGVNTFQFWIKRNCQNDPKHYYRKSKFIPECSFGQTNEPSIMKNLNQTFGRSVLIFWHRVSFCQAYWLFVFNEWHGALVNFSVCIWAHTRTASPAPDLSLLPPKYGFNLGKSSGNGIHNLSLPIPGKGMWTFTLGMRSRALLHCAKSK